MRKLRRSTPLNPSRIMSESRFADHFAHLEDPRREQGQRHRLDHLLVMALCAVVAGADGWDDIATFARAKADWLGRRLDLKHGTPSGDTFRRVFSAICPEAFAEGFLSWVGGLACKTAGEVIATWAGRPCAVATRRRTRGRRCT